jgi:exonuclease SbcD
VHVIGCISEEPADEVLILNDKKGQPELIVCAVPFLRDRDMRTVEVSENVEDKERKLLEGIKNHYQEVCAAAEQARQRLNPVMPLVAMGHLFAAGGQTVEGDGVRNLYVGTVARVGNDIFPPFVDYLALGHLHVAQMAGGLGNRRYCGSPLPIGFGEARQTKKIYEVDFDNGQAAVTEINVPSFQPLECIRGDWETIAGRLKELCTSTDSVWLEVIYEGQEIISDLRERLDNAIAGSNLEILRVKNNRILQTALNRQPGEENLDELDVHEVFKRCLDARDVPARQREQLIKTYEEALLSLEQEETVGIRL